jgi:hypothetical protein
MRIPAEPRVIIRACKDYDVETLRRIYREGLEELNLRPFGRTLVKPNLVAAGEMFPHAFTRPECGEAMLKALRDRRRRLDGGAGGRRALRHHRADPAGLRAVGLRRHRRRACPA